MQRVTSSRRYGPDRLKVPVILTTFSMIFVPLLPVMAQDRHSASISVIDSREFEGFDKCDINRKLSDTVEKLMDT